MNLSVNVLTTLSARVAMLVLALVSSVVLARVLGPEGRGLFALVLLLPELAITFGTLGFEQANSVYAGLEPSRCRALVWQSAVIAALAGIPIAIAGIAFFALQLPGAGPLLHGPLRLYALPLALVPAGLVALYWSAILRGMNRIILLNVIDVGAKVASLILVVVLVGWLRLGVPGAVWANALVDVGTVVFLIAVFGQVGAWGPPSFDRALLRRTGRFALPAHGGTVMSYLNYRVDQFIIAAMLPPKQLGFYVIAVGLAERLWILTGAVATPLLPHLTNSRDRDPALAAAVARHVILWTGAACLLVFALADVVVRVMYSSGFEAVVAPLRWLLPGIFVLSVGKVLVAEILAREKVWFTMLVSAIATVLNVAGNVALIPRMGISGASVASSFSYSVVSLIVAWYYLRQTGVSWSALVPRQADLLVYSVLWRRVAVFASRHRAAAGRVRS